MAYLCQPLRRYCAPLNQLCFGICIGGVTGEGQRCNTYGDGKSYVRFRVWTKVPKNCQKNGKNETKKVSKKFLKMSKMKQEGDKKRVKKVAKKFQNDVKKSTK